MRVVQTFWSGNNDPLLYSFGWLSPQYNLMSWTLSCLSLKENYENIVLYTDSIGYKIFHDYLQLPYKEIIVQYDNLNCNNNLWAYPKLLTYSLQNKPFMHVDGDVYLPHRLSKEIESGELIAQNAEIGTLYYKHMMNHIMMAPISFPDVLRKAIEKESISSYNAGVIGGNDLEFIKEYCNTAFDFINCNGLNNTSADVNCNILFEQILFHCLAIKNNKTVSTVIKNSINDNGYTYNEFCDFYSFDKKNLMHIIGGHKRNKRICELLSRTLLKKYPEYHKKIVKLFSAEHDRLSEIQSYKNFFNNLSVQWSNIQKEKLFEQEQKSCNYFHFLSNPRETQDKTIIKKNPYLSIYQISEEWDLTSKEKIKRRIEENFPFNNFDIACIPNLLDEGYKEVVVDDLSCNILTLLEKPQTFAAILEKLNNYFPDEIRNKQKEIYNIMLNSLEYLFYNKLIYID